MLPAPPSPSSATHAHALSPSAGMPLSAANEMVSSESAPAGAVYLWNCCASIQCGPLRRLAAGRA
eukprot:875694-Alexandrium_andersonii.AAC.1